MELFNNNTVDPCIFIIKDVINDNSCLYRSLANTLHLRMDKEDNIVNFNSPDNIIRDENFSYDGVLQEEIARELQERAYHWIVSNLDNEYPSLGINISDMITNCHEMSVEDYISYYKFFAGDLIVRNIKRNNKTISGLVPNRWGSILELYGSIGDNPTIRKLVIVWSLLSDKNKGIIWEYIDIMIKIIKHFDEN